MEIPSIKTDNPESAGSLRYVISLTLVATLGGLLFGYDTAVVNGAEKSLVDLYIRPVLDPSNYGYAVSLITQYRILVTFVFYVVLVVISGQIIRLLGIRKGFIISAFLLAVLTIFMMFYLRTGIPLREDSAGIRLVSDSVKGFVVASALIGCIIGGALAGFISKSFGRKIGLVISAVALTISAFGA
jgi:SP family xylose:H+ symportor-like MFS transporter